MLRYRTNKLSLLLIFTLFLLLSTSAFTLIHVSATQSVEIDTFAEETNDSMELNEREIVVFSYEALANALQEENGYTTFYIGANIVATSNMGITIHESKSEVIIDGHPPASPKGLHYQFTQYKVDNVFSTIHVAPDNMSLQSITFQNLKIGGANLDGIVFVPDSVPNVLVHFNNVNYEGPQAITNHSGIVRFVDSTIVMDTTVDPKLQDLAEANHIEIGGTSEVTSLSTASLLWLTNADTKLCILENANVTIRVNGYFLHANSGTPTIRIHQNAAFTLFNDKGFTQIGENVKSFLVEENANVMITQSDPHTLAALRVEETLEVQSGAAFWIFRTGDGVALLFPLAGGRAIFTEPKRVFLYSPNDASLSFADYGTLEILTQSMNIWYGDLSAFGPPSYLWNDTKGAFFSITAHYLADTLLSIEHSLSENAPIRVPLNENNFNLTNTTLMVFGNAYLSVLPIYTKSDVIEGYTDPNSNITLQYRSIGWQEIVISDSSNSDGYFSIRLNKPPLKDEFITIEASVASITIRDMILPIDLPDSEILAFSSIPSDIRFTNIPMPYSSTTVLRDEPNFALSVVDTRANRKAWQVDVSLLEPLTAVLPFKTHVLPDALVFVDETGKETPLTTETFTIYTNEQSLYGISTIQWEETQGILLNVKPGEFYSNVSYTATILWHLMDIP